MLDPLLKAFHDRYGDLDDIQVTRAPGRVNLMGDHTDYNDGFVLPMPVNRGVYVALRPSTDRLARFVSVNYGEAIVYSLNQPDHRVGEGWTSYVRGVVEELRRRNQIPGGFDAAIYGDLPPGAGLSSSAALEVSLASGLQTLFAGTMDPIEVALLCRAVEHEYVGVQCGIMDQFASRLGRRDHALFLDCRTLEYEHVRIPLEQVSVIVLDSRVSRALTTSRYNERREECAGAVMYFQRVDSSVEALRDISIERFEAERGGLSDRLRRRSEHVILENDRVIRATYLLREARLEQFGELMFESHESLRDLYEVSCSELDILVDLASEMHGVLGSRMTGAGFGGCTVSLVEKGAVDEFTTRISHEYEQKTGLVPGVLVVDQSYEVETFSKHEYADGVYGPHRQ